MYGAILGDMIGSPYEFDMGDKTKVFLLFSSRSHFTDDTVMTLAVAEGFMNALEQDSNADDNLIKECIITSMKKYGHRYPDAGYGARFGMWLLIDNPAA